MQAPEHQKRFITMGLLDCFGTFLTAMGAVYTPGQYQTLLNQSLIPATMLASWLFLKTSYSGGQLAAAVLIISGAALSISPQLIGQQPDSLAHRDDEVRGYAVAMYWLSNVPMACSAVYKEARFSREPMDVTYLTQWVSIWQMLFGFALAPLQVFPGVGSASGHSLQSICAGFARGWRCFTDGLSAEVVAIAFGAVPATRYGGAARDDALPRGSWAALPEPEDGATCGPEHAFLLIGYVALNFVFNTLGLYLTKHGGAVLNSISYSLLLPLTTMLFSLPLLGPYRESSYPSTYAGLLTVMLGFALWRYYQAEHERALEHAITSASTEESSRAKHEPYVPPVVTALEVPLERTTSLGAEGSSRAAAPAVRPLIAKLRSQSKSVGSEPSSGSLDPPSPPASFQERVIGIGRIARSSKDVDEPL